MASLPHDALYRAKGGVYLDKFNGCELITDCGYVTRKEADWLLYTMMIDAGFKKHRAGLARLAVRIGGRRHWGGKSPYGKK